MFDYGRLRKAVWEVSTAAAVFEAVGGRIDNPSMSLCLLKEWMETSYQHDEELHGFLTRSSSEGYTDVTELIFGDMLRAVMSAVGAEACGRALVRVFGEPDAKKCVRRASGTKPTSKSGG